jgi:pterin-4a-carbinolamine dehydratase
VEVLGKIRKFAQFLKLDYNMDTIQIKDKRFKTFIPEADILKEVARVANEINHDLEGENPLFLSVLNGSFMLRPI